KPVRQSLPCGRKMPVDSGVMWSVFLMLHDKYHLLGQDLKLHPIVAVALDKRTLKEYFQFNVRTKNIDFASNS
ncbi:MAG TPA: hypothetical protein VLH18_03970, partial [Candidatus Limnocylindrales bacterium]|nr:hypothetical protein [Candidatus Limnocylindrales bacterium]